MNTTTFADISINRPNHGISLFPPLDTATGTQRPSAKNISCLGPEDSIMNAASTARDKTFEEAMALASGQKGLQQNNLFGTNNIVLSMHQSCLNSVAREQWEQKSMLQTLSMKKKTKITENTRDNTFLVGESTF